MISECANAECSRPFDHHEGRFFRFRQDTSERAQPANSHRVQHFWLCGNCAEKYTLQARPQTFGIHPESVSSMSREARGTSCAQVASTSTVQLISRLRVPSQGGYDLVLLAS